MKSIVLGLVLWSMLTGFLLAQTNTAKSTDAAATTNTPAATNAPALAPEPDAPAPEWVGFVRVLKDEKGAVKAVRLVAGDKLMAIDLNDKGLELAKAPKTRRVAVKGQLEERAGRTWLVVSDFTDAPVSATPVPEPVPAPAPSTNAPAAP